MNQDTPSKKILRRLIRQERNQMPPSVKRKNAKALLKILKNRPEFITSQKIAGYWPNDGEIDPRPFMYHAYTVGKQCYLPILDASRTDANYLLFAPYKPGDPLTPNTFGIPEPNLIEAPAILPENVDLVLLPLIAFDTSGQRLGRGKGYYDRSFAFIKKAIGAENGCKPILIGIGFEFQEVEQLPLDEWDVPLYAIATEKRFIKIELMGEKNQGEESDT